MGCKFLRIKMAYSFTSVLDRSSDVTFRIGRLPQIHPHQMFAQVLRSNLIARLLGDSHVKAVATNSNWVSPAVPSKVVQSRP